MGYSYGRSASGRMALSCDHCGQVGGVRKRKCPFKVMDSGLRTKGVRYALSYCPAPAYCAKCFSANGGSKGIHEFCQEPARKAQEKYDAERAKLEAGELHVTSAYGDWCASVSKGWVGVVFADLEGNEVFVEIAQEQYDPGKKPWLSDYPARFAWSGPRIKQVA